jgi:hypothetical protein
LQPEGENECSMFSAKLGKNDAGKQAHFDVHNKTERQLQAGLFARNGKTKRKA